MLKNNTKRKSCKTQTTEHEFGKKKNIDNDKKKKNYTEKVTPTVPEQAL